MNTKTETALEEIVEDLRTDPFNKTALEAVKKGADVTGYRLAQTLRAIQRKYPELLWIGQCMGTYSNEEKLPFFGAMLGTRGHEVLRKL